MNPNESINVVESAVNHMGEPVYEAQGLTKREWLVGMIASGLAGHPDGWCHSRKDMAYDCISLANEIIRQMNEEKG